MWKKKKKILRVINTAKFEIRKQSVSKINVIMLSIYIYTVGRDDVAPGFKVYKKTQNTQMKINYKYKL